MSKKSKKKGKQTKTPKLKKQRLPKVAENADFLSLLMRTKNKKIRNKIFDIANRSQLDSISEIIINVLRGTLILSSVQQERLRRYKNCLRLLATKSTPLYVKRKQLRTYSGGFLPALIGLAAPVISSLLGGIFGRK